MRLETSGPPIILFSTYWPSQDSISALHQRDNIASEVNQIINSQNCIPIILEDMNTVFKEMTDLVIIPIKRMPATKIYARQPPGSYRILLNDLGT